MFIPIGTKVTLTYDMRPIMPVNGSPINHYKAEVIKKLKTGFKVKNLDESGLYEDVIFRPNGTARGWNTLTWDFTREG